MMGKTARMRKTKKATTTARKVTITEKIGKIANTKKTNKIKKQLHRRQ